MRTSKKVLLYAMICIAAHKILEFILLYFTGKQFSDVSIICWYTFWGYELRLLAGLKQVESSTPYVTGGTYATHSNNTNNDKPEEEAAD